MLHGYLPTDICLRAPMQCPVLTPSIAYAISGTDRVYGTPRRLRTRYVVRGTELAYAATITLRHVRLIELQQLNQVSPYPMSGTGIAYGTE
eukprot:3332288-Rhodomonas_salina.1